MGDLRDQLKKAKLLSAKKERQLAHEERVHRKAVGREGVEQEQQQHRAEIERKRDADREITRAAQEEFDGKRQAAAESAACEEILRTDVVQPRGRGQRWYFQLEDGSLPWFELDDSLRFQLQSGAFWIVRTGPRGSHVYGLLPADLGKRVHQTLPDAVAWAPGGAPPAV